MLDADLKNNPISRKPTMLTFNKTSQYEMNISNQALQALIEDQLKYNNINIKILQAHAWCEKEIYLHLELVVQLPEKQKVIINLLKQLKYRIAKLIYRELQLNLYNITVIY